MDFQSLKWVDRLVGSEIIQVGLDKNEIPKAIAVTQNKVMPAIEAIRKMFKTYYCKSVTLAPEKEAFFDHNYRRTMIISSMISAKP